MVEYQKCIRNTYAYFFVGILITIVTLLLFYKLHAPILFNNNLWAIIGTFVLLLILTFGITYMKPGPAKYLLTIIWLILLAYLIYPIIVLLPFNEVVKYSILTLVFFAILTFFAFAYPDYFLSWGRALTFLLIGLIILGLIGLFLFKSRTFNLIYYLLVIAIFSAFILYDTQVIVKTCQVSSRVDYINQALSLFIDAINLFAGISGAGSS